MCIRDRYQAYPVAHSLPSFAANLSAVRDVYYRIEIFSTHGSRGRDIMGYTKDQVIADVLDVYDAHIAYLHLSGDGGGLATGAVLGTTPETWVDTDQIPAVAARDATSDDRTAQTTQTEKERHD